MTYREREIEALLHGMRSARSLAHRCRLTAQIYPRYRAEEMAESHRHFARAHEYIERVRAHRMEMAQ